MYRKNVESSNIKSIGYEDEVLEVEFLNGSIYVYYNVPEKLFESIMNADSHGRYLNEYIKKANYRYKKIN